MTDAREIIARHLCTMAAQGWSGISAFERAAYRTTAAGMVKAILVSGFRILGPDEIDGPTVEKCAEVADSLSGAWSNSRDVFQAVQEASASDKAFEIASAIRTLKEKRT